MTSANLILRLRTLLDESVAGFYPDLECYRALSDAQKEIVARALVYFNKTNKLPEVLRPLIMGMAGTIAAQANHVDIPADFLKEYSVQYNSKPAYKRHQDKNLAHNLANTFLTGNYYYINSSFIGFETVSDGTMSYTIYYIKSPADITSEVAMSLPDIAVDALLYFASAVLLFKDERKDDSQTAFALFAQNLNNLLEV